MNKRLSPPIILAALALLCGCSAKMVSNPGSVAPAKYAPVNEASRGGTIKYRNQGFGSIRRKRREDAYKQMSQSCGGAYQIDAEGPR